MSLSQASTRSRPCACPVTKRILSWRWGSEIPPFPDPVGAWVLLRGSFSRCLLLGFRSRQLAENVWAALSCWSVCDGLYLYFYWFSLWQTILCICYIRRLQSNIFWAWHMETWLCHLYLFLSIQSHSSILPSPHHLSFKDPLKHYMMGFTHHCLFFPCVNRRLPQFWSDLCVDQQHHNLCGCGWRRFPT